MSKESIKNITKSDSSFTQTFFDHHSLSYINFNGHCLIKSNISIPKKNNRSIYFLQTRALFTKF